MILLDCDGVLADFCGHVEATVGPADWRAWELSECLRPQQLARLEARVEGAPGWVESMPELPNAVGLVRNLLQRPGIPFAFVTATWKRSPYWAYERTRWLESRFGADVPIIHTSAKHLVEGTLIDDKQKHVNAHIDEGRMAYLIRAPYNGELGHSLHDALEAAIEWEAA